MCTLTQAAANAVCLERRMATRPVGSSTRCVKTAAAFFAAGVPLVVGTDCCQGSQIGDPRLRPGARTIHEMELLLRAGLPREVVLTAATRLAADALGVGNTTGTIAPGKVADLVGVGRRSAAGPSCASQSGRRPQSRARRFWSAARLTAYLITADPKCWSSSMVAICESTTIRRVQMAPARDRYRKFIDIVRPIGKDLRGLATNIICSFGVRQPEP